VCWLERELEAAQPLIGRHHLIVGRFDWPEISRFLRGQVEAVTGRDWTELAGSIGRVGMWEFEDYREFQGAIPSE